jgi:hypothetical protein
LSPRVRSALLQDPLFPGADEREFWARAAERNAATASALAGLGLPRHAAVEAFVRHHPGGRVGPGLLV